MKLKRNEIILFKDQNVRLEVNMKDDTVWLNQEQMAQLFGKATSTINEHIKNIYKEGELEEFDTIASATIISTTCLAALDKGLSYIFIN